MSSYSIINGMDALSDDTVMALPMNMTHLQNNGAAAMMTNGTSTEEDDTTVSPQVVAWCWFVIVLFCFFARPSIPDESYRRAARDRERRQRHEDVKKDPVRRKRLIDQSLISKRVMECDSDRNLTLGDVNSDEEKSLGGSVSYSSGDDVNSSVCVICLEPFRVGDTVAWSKGGAECLHVWHKDCIAQWLERPKHDDCPSCRHNILRWEDAEDETLECCTGDEDDLEVPSSSVAIVITDGLISHARRASYSLIGTSVETDTAVDDRGGLPAPYRLRRVVSLDYNTRQMPSLLQRTMFRGTSSTNYSELIAIDSLDADVECQSHRTSVPYDTVSLQRPIKIQRSVSEGPMHKILSTEQPSLLAAGRVALRRVSSGVYSRLSSKFESASRLHDRETYLDDEEEIETKEIDLETGQQSMRLRKAAMII